MNFHIITIFPDIFQSYFSESILGKAQKEGLIKVNIYNLRDWTRDKHKSVDDTPYGGGAGMVMKVGPIFRAIQDLKQKINSNHKVILFSARGGKWTQRRAQKWSKLDDLVLICGRYEEVDERVRSFIDEEISIGDYVLTGGEIPAMVVVDSISRLLPGVLGNQQSLEEESHTQPGQLDHPQYTKPEIFEVEGVKYQVPGVLLSGDHEKIKKWRQRKGRKRTDPS